MNAFKTNKNTKTGKSGEPAHQNTMDGFSYVRGMSTTLKGPLSSFYSTGPVLRLGSSIQTKQSKNRSPIVTSNIGYVLKSIRGGGQALPKSVRNYFEPRFRTDFSQVKVHTDSHASRLARSVNAKAFTSGKDIVFNAGQFSPNSQTGKSLIAHELTHVVQQTGADGIRVDQSKEKSSLSHMAPEPFRAAMVAPGVMIQLAPSGLSCYGYYLYGRANFRNRFDAGVNTRHHQVTLIMRLAINDAVGADTPEVKMARIHAFFIDARDAIEKAWRDSAFALKSNCMADLYNVRVRVLLDYDNPHQTITLWGDQGERSKAKNWQLSDTKTTVRSSPVPIDPTKPPGKDNMQVVDFSQTAVVHEFGHLMGLEHPVCKGSATRCYGVTYEQKNDLMGYGNWISPRDFEPFIRIMQRYGQDCLPDGCNNWQVVSKS